MGLEEDKIYRFNDLPDRLAEEIDDLIKDLLNAVDPFLDGKDRGIVMMALTVVTSVLFSEAIGQTEKIKEAAERISKTIYLNLVTLNGKEENKSE